MTFPQTSLPISDPQPTASVLRARDTRGNTGGFYPAAFSDTPDVSDMDRCHCQKERKKSERTRYSGTAGDKRPGNATTSAP